MLSRFLTAFVLALFIKPAFAWDYAQDPLSWIDGSVTSPNVALMIDDSTSMHYQMASESYQRVKSGMDSFTISPWYVCTNYNNSTKRCTSVFATALADMAGVNTANPTETGITVYQDSLGATVPSYVYQGNGNDDEVPGAALCNVHKNPGAAGFYLGKSGSSWLASAASSDIGVLVSKSTSGTGTNDACVRWKLATTGMVGGVDEYTTYPGDYASFLLSKYVGATPKSLNFSDTATYPDADPDPYTFNPVVDDKIIPNITRLESARQLSQTFIQDNYKRTQIGLFSFDSEMDRACGDGSNPEADKTALLGLVSEFRATELGSPLARTQTKINNYFKGPTSPIRYRCQKNFSVVVTDGEPDNDTGTLDGAAQTGYDTDAKTSGNDLGGASWNDPSFGSRWVKQNVITHTVGLGLENNLLKRTPLVDRITVPPTNIISNAIRIPAHGLFTGSYIEVVSGAAPGLSNGNFYYVAQIDADRFKLADTKAKAFTCAANTTADCISFASGGTNMTISTGSGKSFFLNDMDGVSAGLSEDMASIYALSATVAIATNSKNIDAGSLVYQAKFNTEDWSGEIVAYRPNAITGEVNTYLPPIWTTKTTLDSPAERGTLLTWNRDANAGAPFTSLGSIGATQSALLNNDINVLNWLRGLAIFTPGFRDHSANGLMGDVINSNVLYVGAEDYGYSQLPAAGNTGAATYNAFVASNASRNPMLFVGANNGMLHGFNANSGAEKIAFIPSGVYEDWNDVNKNNVKDAGEVEKKLFNLTQENYEHRLFVDGATSASDAFIGNSWKTYLVGALGAGGRSVYALDITDDTFSATDVKWEFSHSELGRTYGTPVIARFADNKWYAVFANGPDSASGKASVFIVNLADPTNYRVLTTNFGNNATPNGMMTVQVKFDSQHTATAIYGGDLQGHIWKFDVHAAGIFPSGLLLFNAKDSTGAQQPITGGITLGEHPDGLGTMVYFGTGKYFEKSDKGFTASSSPQINSFYSVLDNGDSNNLTRADLVQQTFSVSSMRVRTSTSNPVNYFGGVQGWHIDLMNGATKEGESVITTPVLDNNHVVFSSQIISGDACFTTGFSYLNVLSAVDGSAPYDRVLDTDGSGYIDNNDSHASSFEIQAPISAPVLINNGANSYAFLSSMSYANSIQRVAIVSPPAVDTDGDGLIDSMDADDDNDGALDINDYFPLDAAEFLDTDYDYVGNNADTDDDNDGIPDGSDPLPLGVDGSADFDNDGISNAADPDDDNDGVLDGADAFPRNATESADYDHDGTGNNADTDDDNDGVDDVYDAFPLNAAESRDYDHDGIGDNADNDKDNDGVTDAADRFPDDSTEAYDSDNDGTGNNADTDDDNDGVPDTSDVFPLNAAESADNDNDGIGNSADEDDDNDGVPDISDAFPFNPKEFADNDNDGMGDKADADDDNDGVKDYRDAFPFDATESVDSDSDGIGDNGDTDDDNDGVDDSSDAFPLDASETIDTDGDGIGNNADIDDDNDGVEDTYDAFPFDPTESVDTDDDGIGDNFDDDDDNDGVEDSSDAFPFDVTESVDTDGDGVGDNADTDDDNDGVEDTNDAFPFDATESVDADGDGIGDNADVDDDNDSVNDWEDNCILVLNADQLNTDNDAQGNACDVDDDNDGVADASDAFPFDTTEAVDTDSDNVGDNTDNCVSVSNANQLNTDGDSEGNACDNDDDNDGVADASDAFPLDATESVDTDSDTVGDNTDNCVAVANTDQLDTDADGAGDVCDNTPNGDTDNDGIDNAIDNCVSVSNTDQLNTDGDSEGNECDNDDDNDGVADASDAFPLDASESVDTDADAVGDNTDNCIAVANTDQLDTDTDGTGDVCDNTPNGDTDNDSIDNHADNCVNVSNTDQLNTDADTQGNVCDNDDDNDGVTDVSDNCPLIANINQLDYDADNIGDACDEAVPLPDDIAGVMKNAKAGSAVAFAGDVNGDGYGDYVIGMPGYDIPAAPPLKSIKGAGRAEVISGKTGAVLMSVNGVAAKDAMGFAVAGNDDIDNDGFDDVLVGAPNADDFSFGLADAGSATILFGPNGNRTHPFFGKTKKSLSGSAVALADVNGDNHADIIMGAPKADDVARSLVDAGNVTVISGNGYSVLNTLYVAKAKANSGTSVAAGDINHDGNADIIIGAPNDDDATNKLKDAGSVSVYDISGTELLRKYGAVANAHFGKSVASGDVNHDGVDDVLVGAPDDDNAKLKDAGSVTVFSGSDGSQLVKKIGAVAKANLGNSVTAGDVNADGYADIIAGAWKDDSPTTPKITKDTGSVSVWSGNGYGLINTVYGDAAKDYFGTAVSAGDINSDGKSDLIIGIPGFGIVMKDTGGVKVLSGAGL